MQPLPNDCSDLMSTFKMHFNYILVLQKLRQFPCCCCSHSVIIHIVVQWLLMLKEFCKLFRSTSFIKWEVLTKVKRFLWIGVCHDILFFDTKHHFLLIICKLYAFLFLWFYDSILEMSKYRICDTLFKFGIEKSN